MRGRHAAPQSISSMICGAICAIIVVAAVIVSFFGSWDKFLIKVIEELPFGEAMFGMIAAFLEVGTEHLQGVEKDVSVAAVLEDCMKLLLAAVFLPIVRFFAGYVYEGRHAAERTMGQRILDFFVKHVVLPVIVALGAAWVVSYLNDLIWQMGDVLGWIFSIGLSGILIGISVWAFCTLAAQTLLWGIVYMLAKVVPAALRAMAAYVVMLGILLIIDYPACLGALGPMLLVLFVIVLLLSIADVQFEKFFKGSNNNKPYDWL